MVHYIRCDQAFVSDLEGTPQNAVLERSLRIAEDREVFLRKCVH